MRGQERERGRLDQSLKTFDLSYVLICKQIKMKSGCRLAALFVVCVGNILDKILEEIKLFALHDTSFPAKSF